MPDHLAGPPPREAIDYIRRKRLRTGWDYRDVWREEHARSFTVANMMRLDLLADVQDSLATAQREGKPFEQWRREWVAELSKRGWWGRVAPPDPDDPEARAKADLYVSRRLATIWRVNMGQAYQAGVWERGQRSTSHPYLLYRVGPSRVHRPQHAAWDGTMLPKDDPFWRIANPRNGWGCKCTTRFVSRAQAERYRRDKLPGGKELSERRPRLREKTYYNPRSGKTHVGYEGIDPGFEYNPGAGRDEQLRRAFRDRTHNIYRDLRPRQQPLATRLRVNVSEGHDGAVARALAAAGRVHGVPEDLWPATVITIALPSHMEGGYNFQSRTVAINETTDVADLACLHELAHHLDYWLLRTPEAAGPREEITRLISRSRAHQALARLRAGASDEDAKTIDYALRRRELWSRAYSQWVAWRSRHRLLLDRIDDLLRQSGPGRLEAWSVADFAPIAQAFDELMVAIGWAQYGG